jgi:SAM-dependent methyltransferase
VTPWTRLHEQERHFLKFPSESVVRFLSGKPAGALLDLGCGAGRHSRLALEFGHQVTACDVALPALRRTQSVCGNYGFLQTAQCSMTSLPFPDASYDYVLSIHVAYYGDEAETEQALEECRRVLKPGGQALISLRTDADWRASLPGEPVGFTARRFTSDSGSEKGMTVTFLSNGHLRLLLRPWGHVQIGREDTFNGERRESFWSVIGTK